MKSAVTSHPVYFAKARNARARCSGVIRRILSDQGLFWLEIIMTESASEQAWMHRRESWHGDAFIRVMHGAPRPPGWCEFTSCAC